MITIFNRKIRTILLIAVLLATAVAIRQGKKEKNDNPKTIVEANHFYSETEKLATYNITDIQKDKALVLLLKKNRKKSNYVTDFAISLQSEQQKIECNFKKITDLCIIEKTSSTKVSMIIECKALPCDVSWVIYQPEAKPPKSNEIAMNLFTLGESGDHLMGQISCNDPSIDSLDKDTMIYSQSPFRRIYKNNILYILFNNQEKGYVYIDIDKKSRACSHIVFTQPPQIITPSENITSNFVLKQSQVVYQLSEIPKNDFRFECSTLRLDSNLQVHSSMRVILMGIKDKKLSEIMKHQLIVSPLRSNEFTIAFKKIQSYEKLSIHFEVSNSQVVLLDTRFTIGDIHLIQLGQKIFFNLKKEQKINFKIRADDEAEDKEMIYIIPKREEEILSSKKSCSAKEGCEFSVSALNDTQNLVFISSKQINSTSINSDGKGFYQFQPIQFISIKSKSKHKIRLGDSIFFKKQIKQNQTIQVHINNPNAIMYASCDTKCQVPDQQCRQRTGNFHHPFVYYSKQGCNFLINVEGLQNSEFQLTILQQGSFIELDDGVPFSYTMDSKQDRVDFKIKLKEKNDISFNLVAPLNSLILLVSNDKDQLPELDSSEQSTDGYILMQKDMMAGLEFIVSVIKMKEFSSLFTHFTLVASTKQANIRLQPSVTNYQTLQPQHSRDFIFEFDPTQNYILSFYAYNLKDQKIELQAKISDEQKKWDNAFALTISKQTDFLDLDELAKVLCEEQGVDSCEIFLRITNKMAIQVDFTLILLMRNAVVELKDGIWQAFPQTLLTATTNFYFYPRHENQDIFISYHTAFKDLRIAYNLWKYSSDEIIETQWPFPKIVDKQQQLHSNFKPNSYVVIDHEQMKQKCWPYCILLISFYINFQATDLGKISPEFYQNMNFKLMVSNNHIQLPQKHKMSLTIGKDQDRILLVDLKYAMTKQVIRFFTNTLIGSCSINANVYSQKHTECPTSQSESDFQIIGETQFQIQEIKKKLEQKSMLNDNNLYLCIDIHSDSSCKLSLEYSTDSEGFKRIHTDTSEDIELVGKESKFYQIDGFFQQFAKITRISGFPFISIKKCAKKVEFNQCMEDFKASTDKGKQIVVKMQSFEEKPCPECIYLFKFSSVEPAKINFHLQSSYSELELKQMNILSDFLNQGQTSKYLINANAKQDLIVNIHIQQGQAQVQITNLNTINLSKKSDSKNKIIHFVIKALDKAEVQETNGLINPNALSSDFIIYHVVIKSIDSNKAVSYTISYSSGKRELYLQDGLILDYLLEPNKMSTFYYFNENTGSHIYYSLSMSNSAALNQLKIKSYYLQDPNDPDSKQEITLDRPTMNKKTPNPTILFSLPSHNFFIFELTNPSSKEQKISMGINHQQVILLPFDHEFPFQLHKNESLNILADVNIPGYVEVIIKKCDRAEPNFAYSFDYDGFIKQQFMYQTKLNEQPYFHYTVKANRIGTLYINFKADLQQDSTLSLKIIHTEWKPKTTKMKAGKRGILSYELIGEKNAKITIPSADCEGTPCKGIKYYFLSSPVQQEVYTQLVCSSNFFSVAGFNSTVAPLTLYKVQGKQMNKTLIFDFPMSASSIFLGIKAVMPTGQQTYYQPIEVASLWAIWNHQSIYQRITMLFLVALIICSCLLLVRKASRKGYKPLDESQQ